MKIAKVLCLVPEISQGSSYYRSNLPLKRLENSKPDFFQFTFESQIQAADLYGYDVLFIQRPDNPLHVELIKRARQLKIKVWIDYDDNMFAVPYHHKDYEYFIHDMTRKSVAECLQLADIVSVTTKELKEAFDSFTKNIQIIPNAIDDFVFPEPNKPRVDDNKIIAWRGGPTHNLDLLTIKEDIRELSKKAFKLVFIGEKPWIIHDALTPGTFSWIGYSKTTEEFFNTMSRINANFHIVPLEDIPLNRCKSNIAFLEATWFGASIVVAPQFWCHEFHEYCLNSPSEIKEISTYWTQVDKVKFILCAQEFVRENYLLSKVNKLRVELLLSL